MTAGHSPAVIPTSPGDAPSPSRVELPLAYNVTVADVMSRPPVIIGPEASLFDALVLMRIHDVTGLPVVDASGAVVGVLSQKDVARSVAVPIDLPDVKGLLDILLVGLQEQTHALLAKLRATLELLNVRSAMARPAFVIHPQAPLELAMEVMAENEIGRLPVVDRGRLVGIVTPTDLISASLRGAPGAPGTPSP